MSYTEQFSSSNSDLLAEIAEFTSKHHPHAHMLSGQVQGRLLEMISKMLQPKKVLEIGTFTGFSALCLASGLVKGGELHTIEIRKEDAERAKQYFKVSVWSNQIILHLGNALDIIPTLEGPFDLVFIDADKAGYLDYYKLVLPKLRSGGVILADNVLFHGEVLETEVKGKNAQAIQAFNEYIMKDESVEKVMLTVRDGLYLIRKK